MIFQIPLLNSRTPRELWTRCLTYLSTSSFTHGSTKTLVGAPLSLQALGLISPTIEKGAIGIWVWGAEAQTDLSLQLRALRLVQSEPSPGPSLHSPSTLRCRCQSPRKAAGKAAARCLRYALVEAGFPVPGALGPGAQALCSTSLPGSPALRKLGCTAAEVLGPTGLGTCPAVRHPNPVPAGE